MTAADVHRFIRVEGLGFANLGVGVWVEGFTQAMHISCHSIIVCVLSSVALLFLLVVVVVASACKDRDLGRPANASSGRSNARASSLTATHSP